MFVTTKELLIKATEGGYALGAFNVENAEMAAAVIAAAEEMRAPVILQTTSSTLRYLPPAYYAGLIRRAAECASVPVALHLDHGSGYELAETCLKEGYSSIMIDGSALSFDENVELSAGVCKLAAGYQVPVEAELGVVGGKEDDTEADGPLYTDPAQAAEFVKRTGVDSLAIAIGTAHGFYPTTPVLDLGRITAVRKLVSVPLVLHGASGVPDKTVGEAVSLGMAKVNFATELRDTYTRAVRETLAEDPKAYDPKKYGKAGMAAVKALVMHKIEVCKSGGKA